MPTILFLSESCLLDRKSGAAMSVRAQLKALARAGWQAHTATLTLFDGDAEYSLDLAQPTRVPQAHAGTSLVLDDEGIAHTLLVTQSSRHAAVQPSEMRAFHAMAQQRLEQLRPDVVLTYSSPLMQPLLDQARQQGARTVFYLANAGYAQREDFAFRFIDEFLVPSQAMAALYRPMLGQEAQVVRTLAQPPLDGQRNLAPERVAARRAQRFVTMVNPEPSKGGQFFLNLVVQAQVLAPELRFRAVESRWDRSEWARRGMDAAVLDAVDWLPHTDDMAPVFEEAALLLVPSLWFEASGRVVAEALLAGVPVLAMKSGGIEEQLNSGGFLFDVPPALQADFLAPPDKTDLHQWLHVIRVLMDNDALYTQAVQLALQAARRYEPVRAEAAVVATFEALARRPVVAGLSENPEALQRLAAQRERMNAVRQAVNASWQGGTPTDGTTQEAQEPYAALLKLSLAQPAIRDAMAASQAGEADRAQAILEQYLGLLPEDITALALLADVAEQQGREAQACRLMERVVELAPGFVRGHQQLLRYRRAAGPADNRPIAPSLAQPSVTSL